MPKFLVLKILDSQSITLPNTLVYGSVELRPAKSDSEDEVEILKESASLNRADFDKYSYCARIATIVDSNNIAEAIDSSDNLFSTVLDLKSKEFVISNVKTSDIGFVKELESGGIHPIPKAGHGLSMSFVVNQGEVQQFDSVNHILSLDSDLSNRYLRSLHWSRNSKHESKTQLKILFHWFSIEALLKESENDNVGGIVRWFLGFPNGRYRNDVTASCLATIRDHPSYTYWDKELIDIVDRIRVFRNDSVHAGFRKADFSKYDLELYSNIMVYSASRCQSAVQDALLNGISSVSEFKAGVGPIFEKNKNLVNDVHHNILFSLDELKSNHDFDLRPEM